MARGDDIFVRFRVPFLLDDSRYIRLTGDQQSLWVFLEATALRNRRQVLPAKITPAEIAFHLRRDTEGVDRDLAVLEAEPSHLIDRLPDGRINVRGAQKHHGSRFGWKDAQTELSEIAESSHSEAAHSEAARSKGIADDHTPDVPHSCPTRAPLVPRTGNDRGTDVDVDGDGEKRPVVAAVVDHSGSENARARAGEDTAGSLMERAGTATATATAASDGRFMRASKAFTEATRGWNWASFKNARKLKELVEERLSGTYDQALYCLCHAYDCDKPGSLLHRLQRARYAPTDAGTAWAKLALNEATPKLPAQGKATTERLGDVLAKAVVGRRKASNGPTGAP